MSSKSCGLDSFAFIVNRHDIANLPSPSIWLEEDHYLILLSVSGDNARIYDPAFSSERTIKLPAAEDTEFQASVITLEKPAFLERDSA